MRAWLLEGFGGIKQLSLASVPNIQPGVNELLIKIHYAALNPADRFLAEGLYPARPAFPHILGRDGCGVVVSQSNGSHPFKLGDRVLILRSEVGMTRPGTLAEFVAVPVESVAAIPTGWTDPQAAAAPLVYLTAYQALTQWGALPEQSVVLVTGASGGVGVATIQLAAAMKFRVLALSRSPEKRATLQSIGVEQSFDPTSLDWVDRVKKHLEGKRVDLAVDSVAGPAFSGLIATLGDNGKISVVGRSGGEVPSFNTATLFFKRLRIGGVAVGAYTPPESQKAWSQIVSLLQSTQSRPIIDSIWNFPDLVNAFAALERGPMGKVLIKIS